MAQRSLSGLEWFGLVSGVIGLTVDAYTLASFVPLLSDIGSRPSPTPSLAFWAMAFLSILYTSVVLGFYLRRFGRVRHMQQHDEWQHVDFARVERAALSLTAVVVVPLLIPCCAFGMRALSFALRADRPPGLDLFGGAFIGATLSPIVFPLHFAARHLYAAFDPDYDLGEE